MNDLPSRRASAAYIDHVHCVATGPIASSRAVVCVHPRGPPNSSRTLCVNPRVIDRPTRPWYVSTMSTHVVCGWASNTTSTDSMTIDGKPTVRSTTMWCIVSGSGSPAR